MPLAATTPCLAAESFPIAELESFKVTLSGVSEYPTYKSFETLTATDRNRAPMARFVVVLLYPIILLPARFQSAADGCGRVVE